MTIRRCAPIIQPHRLPKPKWRNWQTRCVQGAVLLRGSGFKSPLRHHHHSALLDSVAWAAPALEQPTSSQHRRFHRWSVGFRATTHPCVVHKACVTLRQTLTLRADAHRQSQPKFPARPAASPPNRRRAPSLTLATTRRCSATGGRPTTSDLRAFWLRLFMVEPTAASSRAERACGERRNRG